MMRIENSSKNNAVTFSEITNSNLVSKEGVERKNQQKDSNNNLHNNRKINEEQIIKSIESANQKIEIHNTKLKFSIHEKTKEIMVKVIDTKTDDVIREIPPEKILDMVAKLWELAGIILDKKV